MERIAVGMLGLGNVGSGVAHLLGQCGDRIAVRSGKRVDLKWAVVRDPAKSRDVDLAGVRLVTDARRVIEDPEVGVVIEAMGGTDPALSLILEALAAGKDVVTANKALLAEHGPQVFAQARKYGRAIAFEGSVGGGIPIIQALGVSLAANQVQSLAAIVNGTCNFILSAMTQDGLTYDVALRQAQELGYAEADPTLDVDGSDTAHKLAILAQLAFGASVKTAQIAREGIDRLQLADLKYAAELGYAIKLLALAKLSDSGLELRVAPTLVKKGTPLAEVRGPYNAIRVVGDAVGDTFFYGRGAGMMPTASAVVGDLIDVVVGRAALTSRALNLWPEAAPAPRLSSAAQVRSRYYLRFTIADRPGVLAALAQALGAHAISIASVIQHDPGDDAPADSPVPLVIMTHSAVEAELTAALAEIDRLDVVRAPSICLGVEE
ncbi:homoserine dehydrogenase [Singulisphaera acidiphila]|uniref:Homoserine dehydrogenase n=1 Tax=Singulisphaera acidiphila (strain ATCC BAA-1392 / DSM 18658 / VKM B-2454 / MOB10) TaxID=886293 RepID=L0DMK3_SINAD|nr:homoserine dehydrogenase [Singulisphaera acidiphila]AGA30055.1 homoserine dehydrogenase [Singulisphaera acidiphila DSM 18658]